MWSYLERSEDFERLFLGDLSFSFSSFIFKLSLSPSFLGLFLSIGVSGLGSAESKSSFFSCLVSIVSKGFSFEASASDFTGALSFSGSSVFSASFNLASFDFASGSFDLDFSFFILSRESVTAVKFTIVRIPGIVAVYSQTNLQ